MTGLSLLVGTLGQANDTEHARESTVFMVYSILAHQFSYCIHDVPVQYSVHGVLEHSPVFYTSFLWVILSWKTYCADLGAFATWDLRACHIEHPASIPQGSTYLLRRYDWTLLLPT